MLRASNWAFETLRPLGYWPAPMAQASVRPLLVVVAATSWTITLQVSSGLPRQFRVRHENMQCSMRFHLLVPGG